MILRPLLVAAVVTMAATPAFAGPSWRDRAEAKQLSQKGRFLLRQGRHEEAADKFAEADTKAPAPSHKLGLAEALAELGQLRAARDVAEACTEDEPARWVERQKQKKCKALMSELEERVPSLSVTIFEPEASKVSVEIDGDGVDVGEPIELEAGEHEVVATAEGYEAFSETVSLDEGAEEGIEIQMTKVPEADTEEEAEEDEAGGLSPIPAYVSWGVGAAGLGIGIGFGIAAIQTTNEVLRVYRCENDVCPPEARNDLDVAKLNGNISTAGFVVGFAGLATGTVLFLLSGDDEEEEPVDEASLEPVLSPSWLGLRGRF